MIYKFLPLFLLFLMSFTTKDNVNNSPKFIETKKVKVSLLSKIETIYNAIHTDNVEMPNIECFTKALNGFYALKEKGIIQKDIITIIDFSLSSAKKRMWVIDLTTNTLLYNTLVSHGMNSGLEYATRFSNSNSSNKSSLGFYATGETYMGKNGFSLKLDGLEKGINSNARNRSVVVHGADYANPSILRSQGFLGRSQGCPAIPQAIKNKVIKTIQGKSCLFIYHPTRRYDLGNKLIG